MALPQRIYLGSAAVAALAAVVYFLTPVRNHADSQYSLLLAQTIWQTGTADLAPQFQDADIVRGYPGYEENRESPYHVERDGERVIYRYPVGSSVLSIPFVIAARTCGWSPVTAAGHYDAAAHEWLERVLAALLAGATAGLLALLAGRMAGPAAGLFIGLALAFGSALWTTSGNALWGHTWAGFLLAAALVLALRDASAPGPLRLALAGLCCASMCAVRPTLAPSALALLGVVLAQQRRAGGAFLIALAGGGLLWLGVYAWLDLPLIAGQHRGHFALDPGWMLVLALLHTVSPSRGLLVVTPVTICVLWLLLRHRRELARHPLAWAAAFAVAAHGGVLLLWARLGGYCFGSRLTTDILPWLVVLGALGWAEARRSTPPVRRVEKTLAGILAAAGIAIHAQGAFNPLTYHWLVHPEWADALADRHFRWSYPQWLAGYVPDPPSRWAPRVKDGTVISLDDPRLWRFFGRGWCDAEPGLRWTGAERAYTFFNLETPCDTRMDWVVYPHPRAGRVVHLVLNGEPLATWRFSTNAVTTQVVRIPAARLRKLNSLWFDLPDAAAAQEELQPGDDPRRLGLQVRSVKFRLKEEKK